MVVILAEKPSVAGNIAHALGCQKSADGSPYYEGNGYVVTWAFGHLFTLQDSQDYDVRYERWALENYPFIPDEFRYKLKEDEKGGVERQFECIKKLFNRSDVEFVVNACDADREAEVIFVLIYQATGSTKPVKRLWINEQTPSEVAAGMNNLLDASEKYNLQQAGLTRQIADWIWGINLTSVATLQYGNGQGVLNIGRLLLAVTKLVYDRTMEIRRFRPVPFYELKGLFHAAGGPYEGIYYKEDNETRFGDKAVLEGLQKEILQGKGNVISKEVTLRKEGPKKLFSLSDLQGYISSRYHDFTPDKVLNVVQKLYEKKILTYPRTPSRYLDESLVQKMEKVVDALAKGSPFKADITFHSGKSVFDSSKVVSHSAITPTYMVPGEDLKEEERVVYSEVVKRFLSQFMPQAEYEVTEVVTEVNGYRFKTKGKRLVSEGWWVLYRGAPKDSEEEGDLKLLPEIRKGEVVSVSGVEILERKTTPPPPYTNETLLKAMENCGKEVDEDDMEHILKGFMIGTEATRGEAIKTVLDVGYIEQKGKSLHVTDMGVSLVERVPFGELLDVNFTGVLEKKLRDIENGEFSKERYLDRVKQVVTDVVRKMKEVNVSIGKARTVLGKCPACGKDVLENDKSYYCSGYKEGCGFSIWKENPLLEKFGLKKIPAAMVKNLLVSRKVTLKVNYTKLIYVELVKGADKWELNFEFPTDEECKDELEELGTCPACKRGRVFEKSYVYSCEFNVKDDPGACQFVIFKDSPLLAKFGVKKIPRALAKNLLGLQRVTYKINPSKFVYCQLLKEQDRWNVKYDFPSQEDNQALREVIGKCPECGRNVYENSIGFFCERNVKDDPDRCKFALYKENKWFARLRKKIDKSTAKSFLLKKSADVKGLFSENKNKSFDATVLMYKDGDYWSFKFPEFKK